MADVKLAPFAAQLGIPDDAHWALVTLSGMTSRNELIAIASSGDAIGAKQIFSANYKDALNESGLRRLEARPFKTGLC